VTQEAIGPHGFDGLLLSDDIGMQALSGTVATRCRRAAAGSDVVLACNGGLAESESVATIAPLLQRRSARSLSAMPVPFCNTSSPSKVAARKPASPRFAQPHLNQCNLRQRFTGYPHRSKRNGRRSTAAAEPAAAEPILEAGFEAWEAAEEAGARTRPWS